MSCPCAVVVSAAALALSAAFAAAAGERTSLFNGKDLAGWTSVADHSVTGGYVAAEPTWFVKDGTVMTTGTPFGYLRTQRGDYGDFLLHVEFRWWRQTERPNSGVFVRLAADTGSFAPRCVENQLCRGKVGDMLGLAGMRLGGLEPKDDYDPSRPLSGITFATRQGKDVERPFGEWNDVEVEAKGDALVCRVNGVEVNRVSGVAAAKGAVALQSEGGAVQFRNVWIEER